MSTHEAVIEVRGLTKRYRGLTGRGGSDPRGRRPVRRSGPWVRMVPARPAIRTFLDFIRQTSGAIRVFGMDPRREGVRVHRRVGYLPGELALYERMTGEVLLRSFAELREGGRWGHDPESGSANSPTNSHSIYLGIHAARPERMKTILRQPVDP